MSNGCDVIWAYYLERNQWPSTLFDIFSRLRNFFNTLLHCFGKIIPLVRIISEGNLNGQNSYRKWYFFSLIYSGLLNFVQCNLHKICSISVCYINAWNFGKDVDATLYFRFQITIYSSFGFWSLLHWKWRKLIYFSAFYIIWLNVHIEFIIFVLCCLSEKNDLFRICL